MTSNACRTALIRGVAIVMAVLCGGKALAQETVDLAGATIVIRGGQLPNAEQTAARMLVEELQKRIGKRLRVSTSWPRDGIVVALTSSSADAAGGHAVPKREGGDRPETRPEGYRLFIEGGKIVWV